MQDPGEHATPQDGDAPGPVSPAAGKTRPRWYPRVPRWLTAGHWRGLTWGDLAAGRRSRSRFEPGPLGLLGVMLAAMALTMLFFQTGSGGVGGADEGLADEPVPVPGPPEGELRIMLVGDSATQGSSGDHTWRYHLWSHLTEQGVDFDFVGPHDDMYSLEDGDHGDHSYAVPDFDTSHAARWGATAQVLSSDIAQVAAEHEPHYLLLLAGTEDILSGGGADHALDGIAETVSTVRVVLDGARFVVGELPRVKGADDDGRVNGEIDRFNMGLVDLAGQLTSEASPMVVARVAEGYAPAQDNWDATNPNVRGELKIAAAFADALADPLGVGAGFPRPLPQLSAGPLTAPEPQYEETEEGLLLTWETVPGATDYRVVQRRVSPNPDEASVLPGQVDSDGSQRSLLVGSLFSGARYEFVVRPFKGRDEGAESEPLQLVWDDEPPPAPAWVRVREGGSVVTWEEVEEAGHYEVWIRVLECRPANDFRMPGDAQGESPLAGRDQDTPGDGDGDGGDAETPRPAPSEAPAPPRPEPGPAPEPSAPSAPEPSNGSSCSPRDGLGPEDGEGWHTLGSTGERARWEASVSGPYEVVIRSYRDYVAGGYSESVLLWEHG